MEYPVVKTPDVYTSMHRAKPGKVYPQLPNKPRSIRDELQVHFEKDALFTVFSFFAPIVVLLSIVLIMIGGVNKEVSYVLGFMCSISVLGILFAGSSMLEVIIFYIKSIFHYKRNVILQDDKYSQALEKYHEDVRKWEKLEARAKDEIYLMSYRRKHFPKNIKAFSGKIAVHPSYSSVKKGAMEVKVFEILSAKFGNKVLINHTTYGVPLMPFRFSELNSKEDEFKLGKYSPLPDFLICDPAIGYCVVIEIDEPYDLKYGYPIHSVESNDLRDKYFLDRSWPVIRFAEIQFVLDAESCCNFIADAINNLTLGLANLPVSVSSTNINKVNCWTDADAIAMEAAGFRESYLPDKPVDGSYNKYSLSDAIYRANGPAIRKRMREKVIEEELELERQRALRLRLEDEASSRYRFIKDENNDLPF